MHEAKGLSKRGTKNPNPQGGYDALGMKRLKNLLPDFRADSLKNTFGWIHKRVHDLANDVF